MAKQRVLIIDDESNSRIGIEFILEATGYEVLSADSVAAALDLIESLSRSGSTPQLVITNFHVLGIDGFTLIESLRQTLEDLPIIVIVGLRDFGIKYRLLDLERVVPLEKPFDEIDLLATIRGALEPCRSLVAAHG